MSGTSQKAIWILHKTEYLWEFPLPDDEPTIVNVGMATAYNSTMHVSLAC